MTHAGWVVTKAAATVGGGCVGDAAEGCADFGVCASLLGWTVLLPRGWSLLAGGLVPLVP